LLAPGPTPLLAMMTEREVARDRGKPTTERARSGRRRAERLQSRLLQEVVGVALVDEVAREAAQGGRVLAQFAFEGVVHSEGMPFSARGRRARVRPGGKKRAEVAAAALWPDSYTSSIAAVGGGGVRDRGHGRVRHSWPP
jgi:hypothetical protein